MPKSSNTRSNAKSQPGILKWWKQIAEFLGEPLSVIKRWASEGMLVSGQGRFVTSSPEQLNAWIVRESGKPVQVVTPETDLASELKRGIAFARRGKKNEDHRADDCFSVRRYLTFCRHRFQMKPPQVSENTFRGHH